MTGDNYDCAIIGGGVGGLALSILLARSGKKVILFEKETYPFHKVCGEYISNESIPFLESLGLDLYGLHLPQMTRLLMSSPSGISVKRPLDIGGTGLSRYVLDARLAEIATDAGVLVADGTKVQSVNFADGIFKVKAGSQAIVAKTVVGAYGKHANIDVQLGRDYKAKKESQLFVAVKHHIVADYDQTFVEMHNFPGGYCGLSAIEDGKVNMSYICKAAQLKKQGSISNLERNVLSTNPYLKKYFDSARFVFAKPLTISHLYFEIKSPVTDHILMLGDAAGNIAPLSGNGMSMSFQSASLANQSILKYLDDKIDLAEMESDYSRQYALHFAKRINIARQIHHFFGKNIITDLGFLLFKLMPGLVDVSGRMIHGKPFL